MSHREGFNQEPGTVDLPALAGRELLVEYLEGDLLVERRIAVAEPGEALKGLPRTRRPGDRQGADALILEYHPQQQERPTGNMIAMQMGDENPVKLGGANPGMIKAEPASTNMFPSASLSRIAWWWRPSECQASPVPRK